MITADKVFKGSTPISKIYQGLNLVWEMAAPIPGADAYVQDGLVFQLDGIEKGGVDGVWKDLVGNKDFTLFNCITNPNNIEFNGTNSQGIAETLGFDSATHTLEFIYSGTKVAGVPFFGGPTSEYLCVMPQGTPLRRLTFGTGMKYLSNPASELKMISANADGIILNGNKVGTSAELEANASYNDTIACLGHYKYANRFLGKIYAIRVYNRKLSYEEMIQNQAIDSVRFGFPMETVNLTLNAPGARFMINKQIYNYTGKTMTFKIMPGTHYQISYDKFSGRQAPSNSEVFTAEAGKVRNITAEYVDNGWGNKLIMDFTSDATAPQSLISAYDSYEIENLEDGTKRLKAVISSSTWGLINVTSSQYLIAIRQWPSIQPAAITIGGYSSTAINSVLTYVAPIILSNAMTALKVQYIQNDFEWNVTIARSKGISNIQLPAGVMDYSRGFQTLNNYVVTNSTSNYVQYYLYSRVTNVDMVVGVHKYGRIMRASYERNEKIGKYYFIFDQFIKADTAITIKPDNNTISSWKYVEFVDLFNTLSELPYNLTALNNWGTGSEENRQSLVKSLVENTVDRTKFSGAKPVTIQLDPAVKALLTADEIAQITAKGYTIV